MAVRRDRLFPHCHDTKMRPDVDDAFPGSAEGYGLARTWSAALDIDESIVTHLQQDLQLIRCIAARTIVAHEAVGLMYCDAVFHADASIAAVRQITDALSVNRGIPALEEFHHTQRTKFLAQLSQITERGVARILAEI